MSVPKTLRAGLVLTALAAGSSVLVGACQGTGYITLDISTNALCVDVGGTAITVGALGQIETRPAVASTDACGPDGAIGTLTVLPSGSEDDEVAVKVTLGFHQPGDACTPPDYKGCIVARRVARYVHGRETRLAIAMDIACKDVPCGELETCAHGRCVPVACADGEGCDALVDGSAAESAVGDAASVEDALLVDAPSAPDASSSDATAESGSADAALDAEPSAPDFAYRRSITVDRTKVGLDGAPATSANYPLLVAVTDPELRSVANGGHVESPNGHDIVFRVVGDAVMCGGPSECTLDHEVESYEPASGSLTAWVRLPLVQTISSSTDTVVYAYYGKPGVTASTQNRAEVWDANFRGVWHLTEFPSATAPQMADSTANANDGTTHGTMLAGQRVAGVVGHAVGLDGVNDYVEIPASASLEFGANAAFTWGAWVKTSEVAAVNVWPSILSKEDRFSSPRTGFNLVLHDSNVDPRWYPEIWVAGAKFGPKCNDVADGAWHYLVGTRSGSTVTGYQDGSLAATLAASSGSTIKSGTPLVFGAALSAIPFSYLNGAIDEVRVSNVARSADWIRTEFNNLSSPATFETIGVAQHL